jgi:transcriptional regulator GlxA family with amidase domain
MQRTAQGPHRITAPLKEAISVAFVIGDGVTVIDFGGPWEVFHDVTARGADGEIGNAFNLYTVAATREPIRASGGLKLVADYTYENAPEPRIVVVPAQRGTPQLLDWLRKRRADSDVLMSVCTGAFQLGRAGLLDGKRATTHHDFYENFQKAFPSVSLVKGQRYVQSDDVVFTAGGLSSGIDLALHIVQLYFGREVAEQTAVYMEYQSRAWEQ